MEELQIHVRTDNDSLWSFMPHGAQVELQAEQLYLKSKEILREGGFNVRKFMTNSDVLQQKIDAHNEVCKKQGLSSMVVHSEEMYTLSQHWELHSRHWQGNRNF